MILRTGDRGPQVTNLQLMLKELGVAPNLKDDGDFGTKTYDAVRALQMRLGIKDDGIVGPGTLDKIIGTPLPRYGDRGPKVRALQLKLGITADGVYGGGTRSALGGAAPVVAPRPSDGDRRDFRLSAHFSARQLVYSSSAAQRGIDNWPDDPVIFRRLAGLCAHILEPMHAHFGKLTINSGYRNLATNRAVGGSSTSNHLKGYAADVEVPGVDNRTLARWVRDNMSYRELLLEFHHVGSPASGWVHVAYAIDSSNNKKTGTITSRGYAQGIS